MKVQRNGEVQYQRENYVTLITNTSVEYIAADVCPVVVC